ncbi:MAG: PorT family protein [Ferruginibacter sp.]|nr:PorT family protein [Cytophagales bacterium]
MLHLPGKKTSIENAPPWAAPRQAVRILIAIFPLWLAADPVLGQKIPSSKQNFYGINQAEYENRIMHYGFFLALHGTHYNLRHSDQFVNYKDSVVAITPKNTNGFGLGFIVNYRFARYFSVRVLPTVSFYTRDIDYAFQSGRSATQSRESTNIELPLLLKYQSERRDNVRMYMVAGIKGSVEANTKKKQGGSERLNVLNKDLAIEYGAGFDLFYEFVKFSPEIRFSHGIADLLVPDRNVYSRGLNRLTTHTVSLYLHFE